MGQPRGWEQEKEGVVGGVEGEGFTELLIVADVCPRSLWLKEGGAAGVEGNKRPLQRPCGVRAQKVPGNGRADS